MKLTGLAQNIFLSKYASPSEAEWHQLAKRVSIYISQAENGNQKDWQQKFFDVINDMDFIPGGRILKNAGFIGQSMMNCLALEPLDNVDSLGDFLKNCYTVTCAGAGIGSNYSKIRPKGDPIRNMKFAAPGVVSEIKKINAIGQEVRGGGSRRTALLGVLNIDHPDLLEYLSVKSDKKSLQNFNLSVGITNKFLKAVERNKEWHFKFGNRDYFVYEVDRIYQNGQHKTIQLTGIDGEDVIGRAYAYYKKNFTDKFKNPKKIAYKARDLWNQILHNALISGDPGLFQLDNTNSFTNVSYFERLNQPNACAELPLPGEAGACCLGSLNLDNFYDEKNNDINWKKLAKVIRVAVRFLDNIVSINAYPLPLSKQTSQRSRRIGLGFMGLGHILIRMNYRYGSQESLEFLERMLGTIRNEAYMASVEIAKEKGAFPAFDAERFLCEEFCKTLPPRIRRAIKNHGIRNACLLSAQPTGTTSLLAGVSSGIEPIFSNIYKRSYRDLQDPSVWQHTIVVDKLFKEFYEAGKDTKHIVGTYDLSIEDHLNIQSTVQKFLDNSTSKTINCPEGTTVDQISDMILDFMSDQLKCLTLYVRNSRGIEPLKIIDVSDPKKLAKIMKDAECGVEESNCKSGKCDL